MNKEENPFEDPQGAQEWINAVENEQGTIRDKEIYPQLATWFSENRPHTVLDIGAGQCICATKLGTEAVEYIGIDPSQSLIERAGELYKKPNRKFLVGNAYNLPLGDESIDASFSITTWFHLRDLDAASRELSRTLRVGGHFMIVTPNPTAYDIWETFYTDTEKKDNVLTGKAKILLNPDEKEHTFAQLSKNIFYLHTMEEILGPLKKYRLKIDTIEEMGILPITAGRNIFIKILGYKK